MEFTHFLPWWIAAIILVIAMGITTVAYWRNRKPISVRLKSLLVILRLLAVGLLLFCLLGPVLTERVEIHKRSNLLVLVDTSQSMAVEDVPIDNQKLSRLEATKGLFFDREKGIFPKLMAAFDVQLYRFDSECKMIETAISETGSQEMLPSSADGILTDLGGAISKAVNDWKGQPITGVVLLTDGRDNSGRSPLDAANLDVPVYPVGVGNPVAPKDIKLGKIEVAPVAYVGHNVPVNVKLVNSGYDGEKIQVNLFQGKRVVDSAFVTLSKDEAQQNISYEIQPQKEGNFGYAVSVPALPDEFTTENNQASFFLKVIKSKLRVLYIDSRPRWEYAFLQRTLKRNPHIDADSLILSSKSPARRRGTLLARTAGYYPREPGKQDQAQRFPGTAAALNAYDVLIIGDMQPRDFTPQQLKFVKDFVELRGKAVIFLGGQRSLGRNGFGKGELQNLLPAIIPPNGGFTRDEDFNPSLAAEGVYHPITRLGDSRSENEAVWRDLPPLTRLYIGAKPRAGAIVLAKYRQGRNVPVIIFQRYGNGKSLLIAADSLWNWDLGIRAFKEEADYYHLFWAQTIRWMATKADAKLVNVDTNKRIYNLNEEVYITARIYNESYLPTSQADLIVEVSPPEGTPFQIPINPDTEIAGVYSAGFRATEKGTYKITITASLGGVKLGTDAVEFVVEIPLIEFDNPQLNEELLKRLAESSSGSYTKLEEVNSLPEKIKDVGEIIVETHENELWDNPIVLIIVVGILGAEWVLRKWKGLV